MNMAPLVRPQRWRLFAFFAGRPIQKSETPLRNVMRQRQAHDDTVEVTDRFRSNTVSWS
jgi:hypothetical protein